jgi:ParB family chromosome partitioning protein
MPGLVLISEQHALPEGTPILARRRYVEVVTRKARGRKESRPEQRVCNHTKTAIHADGLDKGRLAKVCAESSCKIHFRDEQEEEKQRLVWRAERTENKRKAKQTASFRYRLLSETLKRVKPELGNEQMRIVARFVLQSLPHELALRLAKRHGLQTAKGQNDWEVIEKARTLYRAATSADLARLIFEAILIGSAARVDADKKDDLLTDAATLHKVDAKVLRVAIEKDEKEKAEKKIKAGKKNATRRANRLAGK